MYTRSSEYKKALLFFLFLLIVFVGSIYAAAASVGPIVVSSDMDTYGHVEYLCFGLGCEDIPY